MLLLILGAGGALVMVTLVALVTHRYLRARAHDRIVRAL